MAAIAAVECIKIDVSPEQAAAIRRIDPSGLIARDANGRDILLAVFDSDEVTIHTISADGGSMKQSASIDEEGWVGLGPNSTSFFPQHMRRVGGRP